MPAAVICPVEHTLATRMFILQCCCLPICLAVWHKSFKRFFYMCMQFVFLEVRLLPNEAGMVFERTWCGSQPKLPFFRNDILFALALSLCLSAPICSAAPLTMPRTARLRLESSKLRSPEVSKLAWIVAAAPVSDNALLLLAGVSGAGPGSGMVLQGAVPSLLFRESDGVGDSAPPALHALTARCLLLHIDYVEHPFAMFLLQWEGTDHSAIHARTEEVCPSIAPAFLLSPLTLLLFLLMLCFLIFSPCMQCSIAGGASKKVLPYALLIFLFRRAFMEDSWDDVGS